MSLTKVSFSMINGDVVNILDFGAKGDGITDDTSAISSALAYASSIHTAAPPFGKPYVRGTKVYVPPGRYVITSGLVLPPDVMLYGAGPDSSCFYFELDDSTNAVTLTQLGLLDAGFKFYISDIKLVGQRKVADDWLSGHNVKDIINAETSICSLIFSNVFIEGANRNGVTINAGIYSHLDNVIVSEVCQNGYQATSSSSGDPTTTTLFTSCVATSVFQNAFYFRNVYSTVLEGCTSQGWAMDPSFSGQQEEECYGVKTESCQTVYCTGHHFENGQGAYLYTYNSNVTISGASLLGAPTTLTHSLYPVICMKSAMQWNTNTNTNIAAFFNVASKDYDTTPVRIDHTSAIIDSCLWQTLAQVETGTISSVTSNSFSISSGSTLAVGDLIVFAGQNDVTRTVLSSGAGTVTVQPFVDPPANGTAYTAFSKTTTVASSLYDFAARLNNTGGTTDIFVQSFPTGAVDLPLMSGQLYPSAVADADVREGQWVMYTTAAYGNLTFKTKKGGVVKTGSITLT